MFITWFGHSCFRIQDKTGPDGISLATDPFDKKIGLNVPNFQADIVTVSRDHCDYNNVKTLRGAPYIIDSAGEYDVKGVLVDGVLAYHDDQGGKERGKNIMYRIEMDGIIVTHLGNLGATLDDKQRGRLSGADILLIPVGGKYTIDAKKAVEVVSQLEPRIVIPMHYKLPGLKIDIAGVDKFVKELGIKPTEEEKLKISKRDLPSEDMELIILKH